MELSILGDVMRLATIIWKRELISIDDPELFLESEEEREKFAKHLESENVPSKDLIKPTEVYDIIAGTSVGALNAFALAGGNTGEKGERLPMTLEECTSIYLENAKKIVSGCKWKRIIPSILGICHPKHEFTNILNEKFQDSKLSDFQPDKVRCIPFALVREVHPESKLVSFDGYDQDNGNVKVQEVLKAATNVPILFYNRVEIEDRLVIDGGIGGNCPIGQAIPRAMEIFKTSKLSVLSIAPPIPDTINQKRNICAWTWLKFLYYHIPDGTFVYENVKRQYRGKTKEIMFRRMAPRGDKLKEFTFLDSNVHQIVDEMNSEKKKNKMFLVDIIAIATFVLHTYLARNPASIGSESDSTKRLKHAATLAYIAGKAYETAEKKEKSNVFDSYITCLDLYGMIEEPLKQVDKAFVKVCLSLSGCLEQETDFKEASLRFLKVKDKCMKFPDENTRGELLLVLIRYIIEHESVKSVEKINVLEEARKILKKQDMPKVAELYSQIAFVHSKAREYPKAVKNEKKALKIRKNPRYFPDKKNRNINKAESLESLGGYFFVQEKFGDAMKYFKKYLKVICKRLDWKHDENHVKGLKNLGECFYHEQRHKKARSLFQRALAILQGLEIDKNIPLTAELYANIARCLINLGEDDKSLSHANKAVAMAKKYYKDVDHPLIVKTLYIRSEIYEKLASNPNFPEAQNLALEDKKSAEEMEKRLLENK